jgi:uncharacterized DUF497 family protein
VTPRLQWDEGNWPKCGKHGVSREEIEELFTDGPTVEDDPHRNEPRYRAVGRTKAGRWVFCVFTFRAGLVRPISARYMHAREALRYE